MATSNLWPPIRISLDRIGILRDVGGGVQPPLFSCAITAPAGGAVLQTNVLTVISGTLSGPVASITVKLGSTVLGIATIAGATWSYNFTPSGAQAGAQTLNATATNNTGATVNATPVAITVGATPLTIIQSVPVRLWLRADLGVTIATGVSSWVSQEGNAYSFNQATGGLQPTRNAADAALNNRATITGDGADDFLEHTTMPIAATYWRCSVTKINTWAVNRRILATPGGTGRASLLLAGAADSFLLWENSVATSQLLNSSWKRTIDKQSNALTDRLQIGSLVSTGAALGRTALTTGGMSIFSASAGSLPAAASIAEIIITDGHPTSQEESNIDAYLVDRYLASLLT